MPDESRTITGFNTLSTFPFTHLFRGFRLAIHPSKMVLALAMLTMLWLGGKTLDAMWPQAHSYPSTLLSTFSLPDPEESERLRSYISGRQGEVVFVGPFMTVFDFISNQLHASASSVLVLDFRGLLSCLYNVVAVAPDWVIRNHPLFAGIYAIWLCLVWSIFGGAISRIAALHIARDEKPSIRQALRFSTGKLISFVFAPLIPTMIFGVCVLLVALGGLLMYVPVVGPIAVSLLFPLTLLVGVVMTLMLAGLLGGFTLMYPTIAVEGSDSFDAISRSFSYVYARPWRMGFYALVAVVYGALTYLFMRMLAWVLLSVLHFSESILLFKDSAAEKNWNAIWPEPSFESLIYTVDYSSLGWGESVAASIMSLWVYLIIALLGAYALSYFFSASTMIYYLMRYEVDATEMEDVDIEPEDAQPLDLAGDEPADGLPRASDVTPEDPDQPLKSSQAGQPSPTS